MTFLFKGTIEHYDTATKVWTPLNAGDFQIIQSNSGIQHQEKVAKNSRAFQIWFDPSFYDAVKLTPSYIDYHSKDFKSVEIDGIKTVSYIGEGSSTKALTPNLTIKKLTFDNQTKKEIALNARMSYTFYVLNGKGLADNQAIEKDDTIRISNTTNLQIDFQGDLFYIETPTEIEYKPIWQ
jgi:redox-sensitive bicupin YhaK (pirin superfamily)